MTRHFHLSIRITRIDPGHTHLGIWTGSTLEPDAPLWAYTRGKSGELVIDTNTAEEFIRRLKPVRIEYSEQIEGNPVAPPDWLIRLLHEFNPSVEEMRQFWDSKAEAKP